MSQRTALIAVLTAVGVLSLACAVPHAARMQLPPELQGVESEWIEGAGGARSGRVMLGSVVAEFQRSMERLGLLDQALSRDRASLRLTGKRVPGEAFELRCKAGQTDVSVGIVTGSLQGWTVECRPSGDGESATGVLRLEGRSAAAGTRMERVGTWTEANRTFELRSVHRIEGSPLPQSAPMGYLITYQGAPVGAVELLGSRPRVWRRGGSAVLREDMTVPLLALGLLWDPARQGLH